MVEVAAASKLVTSGICIILIAVAVAVVVDAVWIVLTVGVVVESDKGATKACTE